MIANGAQTTSQRMRITFIGTGEIGLPTLQSLLSSSEQELIGVVTQPDKPTGRSQKITAPPIKVALSHTNVPILQPARIKSPQAVEQIRAWNPDVIVVMAYGQILPRTVLELPRIACLNLHASLLPRHRGAAPIQAAILAGDRETGITVMYMDEGLDTGDILLQTRLEISPNETGGSLHDRLAELASGSLSEALRQLRSGTAPRDPQNSSLATYSPKLTRDDGKIDWTESAESIERKIRICERDWRCSRPTRKLARMRCENRWILRANGPRMRKIPHCDLRSEIKRDDGNRLVGTGRLIERKIRAFNPWPGAFANLSVNSGPFRKLKIFGAFVIDHNKHEPGEILKTQDGAFVIRSKNGALSLGEVQLEGKRRMSAIEFLRGFPESFRVH